MTLPLNMSTIFPMTPDEMLASLRLTAVDLGADISILTECVLTHPGFTTWTGSIGNRHHYGEGGLLRHTYEVVNLCMVNRLAVESMAPHKLDARVLFLSGLTHDWGKLMDYAPQNSYVDGGPWVATSHHHQIHHITRSALLWSKAVAETGLCKDIEDAVLHAILAHHGSPRFRSPVLPQTREAWVLHLCDTMSAWCDSCGKVEVEG